MVIIHKEELCSTLVDGGPKPGGSSTCMASLLGMAAPLPRQRGLGAAPCPRWSPHPVGAHSSCCHRPGEALAPPSTQPTPRGTPGLSCPPVGHASGPLRGMLETGHIATRSEGRAKHTGSCSGLCLLKAPRLSLQLLPTNRPLLCPLGAGVNPVTENPMTTSLGAVESAGVGRFGVVHQRQRPVLARGKQ